MQDWSYFTRLTRPVAFSPLRSPCCVNKSEAFSTSLLPETTKHENSLHSVKFKSSSYSSYLKFISNILNDCSISEVDKQVKLEISLVQYNLEEINTNEMFVKKKPGALLNFSKGTLKELIFRVLETYKLHSNKTGIVKEICETLSQKDILYIIMLTYGLVISYYDKLGYTNIASVLGRKILEYIYLSQKEAKIILKKQGKYCAMEGFNDFLEFSNMDSTKFARLGDYFITLLSQYPIDIFERNYKKSSKSNKEVAIIQINPSFIEMIRTKDYIITSANLPMICKPLEWNAKSYGGYLSNAQLKNSIISKRSDNKHETVNLSNLYKAVNILNSNKFGVNNLLLDYLLNDGKYLLDYYGSNDELSLHITLNLAETLRNTPFYLTTHADWRGRLYTDSFYLTYQGSDLSNSLVNFWDGEPLTETGKDYFYICGANSCDDEGLSKKSYEDRINWVEKNYDKIIKLDRDLISKAKNIFSFTSFCLNMRELDRDPKWIVKTPLFLDATCSGMQHLAAILKDVELGAMVNLSSSTEHDTPADVYTYLLKYINEAIHKYGEDNSEFSHFKLIELTRQIVKNPIMTKVYNVTRYGISQQLQNKMVSYIENVENEIIDKFIDNLESYEYASNAAKLDNNKTKSKFKKVNKSQEESVTSKVKNNKKYVYLAPGLNGKSVRISRADVMQIAKIIDGQIFIVFPTLNDIYKYFTDITDIMSDLGLPIWWITPTGMKITQHYLKTIENKATINLFNTTKKLVMRNIVNELNKPSQVQGIIPNIIHSLDSSHLVKVVIKAKNKGLSQIITVHDCFGTHPNKMETLFQIVKSEFIIIYSKEEFLKNFHTNIIRAIKLNKIKLKKEDSSYYVYNEKKEKYIKLPEIPVLGEMDFKALSNSKYIIT